MTLIERLTSTPDDKRLFEQERVIFEVTELISTLMEEHGVSKADLARKMKTSKANITQMLDGRRNMTLRTLVDVVFQFDASLCITTRSLACGEEWRDVVLRVWSPQPGPMSWQVPSSGQTRDQSQPAGAGSATRLAG